MPGQNGFVWDRELLFKDWMKKAIDHLAKSDPRFADLISRSRKFDVIANKLDRKSVV